MTLSPKTPLEVLFDAGQWTGRRSPDERPRPLLFADDQHPQHQELWAARVQGDHFELVARIAESSPFNLHWAMLFHKHHVMLIHDDQTIHESKQLVERADFNHPSLTDLCHLPFVTIDNQDSRDLDQALYVDATENGFVVWYALADASYYVDSQSHLFQQAAVRGSSYYLPGLSAPMLPRILCEDLISLNPHVIRRALVFEIALNREGRVLETQVHRAKIKSRHKLSYPGVQAMLDGDVEAPDDCGSSLRALQQVGRIRMKLASEHQAIRFRHRSIDVRVSEHHPLKFSVGSNQALPVERYNEQLSLMCNIEGAKLITRHASEDVQSIFKVHPAPQPHDLEQFARLTSITATHYRLPHDPWVWQGPDVQSLAEYLERLPIEGPHHRVTWALDRQARMLNHRSSFQDEPGLHFGIGAPIYARFSAPMREAVGIFTHKELLEALGAVPRTSRERDEQIRDRIIKSGNRAKDIQGRLTKEGNLLILDQFFQHELRKDPTPRHPSTVLGLTATKAYVQMDDPPIEVKLYRADVEQQFGCELVLNGPGTAWTTLNHKTILSLGSAIELEVDHRDDTRNRWIFRVHTH
ncbi:MAG: RNB domain-containing ribonuclease [Acidobacteria bacterium]|nr:RNB domain-containing ribonuclease [Acidobacteriota bacterium]